MVVQKLFKEVGPKFADRDGGYTRIIKLSDYRIGDGGDIVILQLLADESAADRNRPPQRGPSPQAQRPARLNLPSRLLKQSKKRRGIGGYNSAPRLPASRRKIRRRLIVTSSRQRRVLIMGCVIPWPAFFICIAP